MNLVPFQSALPPPLLEPPRFPLLPPEPPNSSSFWENRSLCDHLKELQNTINLAKAMQKELEILMVIKDGKGSLEDVNHGSKKPHLSFLKYLDYRRVSIETQESSTVEAANSLMSKLRAQLEPFRYVADQTSPWEEKSASARFANKVHKSKRNKLWRKKKRQRIAEMLAKEHGQFDQIDREADEWRAREIAKEIASSKVTKMKEIVKLKAKEEKKKLESELELLLMVEKLQELQSIRIQKLKKQGHFLPEEDDKFLETVKAAVEEEERGALAAAETDAAKDAIASAEESRKAIQNQGKLSKESNDDREVKENKEQIVHSVTEEGFGADDEKKPGKIVSERQNYGGAYDPLANLPIEFYHYYHGSNNDMGTLIEVRRGWDAYIRPGGRYVEKKKGLLHNSPSSPTKKNNSPSSTRCPSLTPPPYSTIVVPNLSFRSQHFNLSPLNPKIKLISQSFSFPSKVSTFNLFSKPTNQFKLHQNHHHQFLSLPSSSPILIQKNIVITLQSITPLEVFFLSFTDCFNLRFKIFVIA